MAFPVDVQSTHFSDLMATREADPVTVNEASLKGLFDGTATGDYVRLGHIRDLPAVGAPPNIVNVPEYGRAQTLSIGAQSDAPTLELTLNFVPTQWANSANTWATTGTFADLKRSGQGVWWQLAMLNVRPTGVGGYNCIATGLGSVPNILMYFKGRIESFQIQPARDDATTATISLSLLSDFEGPFTI